MLNVMFVCGQHVKQLAEHLISNPPRIPGDNPINQGRREILK